MDPKDLSVYIARKSTGEQPGHLVMSKKKTVEPKIRRGRAFSQIKKSTSSVAMNKFEYPFKFHETCYKNYSLDSKFKNKTQTAVSSTNYTVITVKSKTVHRKLISNTLPFKQTITAPTKRKKFRQNNAEQPTCSNTPDMGNSGGAPCIYAKKETPQTINHERSEDWLKRKGKPGAIHVTPQEHREEN